MSVADAAAASTAGVGLPIAYASGGSTIHASTDPAETYLVTHTAARNTASAGGTANGVRTEKTPQAVATEARPPLLLPHKPGPTFVTDLRDPDLEGE